jgi:hypothetical protein
MKYNSDPVEGADIRAMASSLQTYFVSLYEQELTGQKRSNAEVKKLPSPMKSKSSSSVTLPSSGALNILAEKSNERGDFIGPDQKKRKKDKKEKKDKREKKKKKDKKKEKKKEKHESLDNNIIQALPVPISSTTLSIETTTSASALVASKTLPPAAVRFAVGVETGKRKKMKKATDLSGWEASAERVLNRMQKIESVSKLHFDRPLLKTFPELSTDYKALVSEPMDLGTLRELLHNHSLIPSEFVTKGKLIFKNALAFNIGEDSASIHVREMADHLLWYFESLCSEQNLLEDAELSKRPTIRQERADLVSTLSMEMKSKECQKLIRVLNSQKYDKICWPFRKPVKVLFPSIPSDYFEIIKSPMDLATVSILRHSVLFILY